LQAYLFFIVKGHKDGGKQGHKDGGKTDLLAAIFVAFNFLHKVSLLFRTNFFSRTVPGVTIQLGRERPNINRRENGKNLSGGEALVAVHSKVRTTWRGEGRIRSHR